MKSIRGEIPWARAAPIHAHTSRPRVCALIRVNSKSGPGLTYIRLTGMELCHCSFPVASAASRASLMRFSTSSNREKRTTVRLRGGSRLPPLLPFLLFAEERKRTRARWVGGVSCIGSRLASFYLCLFKEKEARKRIYTRPNI